MILLLLGFVLIFSQSASTYTQDDFVHQLLSSQDFFWKIKDWRSDINELKSFKLNEEFKLYLKGGGDARFVIVEQNDYQGLLIERIAVLIDLYTNKLMYDSLLDRLLPLKL